MTLTLQAKPRDPLQFSAGGGPIQKRLAALRDLNDSDVLAQNLVPLDKGDVRVELVQQRFAGLGVLSASISGVRQQEKIGRVGPPVNNDIFLGLNLNGYRIARQCGREIIAKDGGALLLSRENGSFLIDNPSSVQFIGLLIPYSRLSSLVQNLDKSVGNVNLEATGAMKLLSRYLGAVMREQDIMTSELQQLVATQVYDLVAVAIGATKDALAAAQGRGIRAARIREIKAYVSASLTATDLTAAAVANVLKISPRYVHKLFESDGLTFSQYVLSQRLERAYRILTDPRFSGRNISSVAYDVGFGDLSYFNRVFRRHYEISPNELRAAHSATSRF